MSKNRQREARVAFPAKHGTNAGPLNAKPGAVQSEVSPLAIGAAQVYELIAGKHSKAALEIAKDLHKRHATAESEIPLVAAYEARIRDLLNQGMSVEAKSLLNLVSGRFPGASARWQEIEFEVRARGDDLNGLVGPLRDPDLAPAIREKIETVIRQRVEDLPALAQVSSLPSTHPLREAAGALAKAFQLVTSGPVDENLLLLPQVPRRSPLASWKALVNAIACFYRDEDESARKWLDAIALDSVPARLVQPIQAMLGGSPVAALSPSAMKLISSVGSGRNPLGLALASLEDAMNAGGKGLILERARDSINLCRQCSPELTEKLRQHISIRCMLLEIPAGVVRAAIGTPREDAHWCRLLARGYEELEGDCEEEERAVICWEAFRKLAIRENWFGPKSVEDGVLSLRMARTVRRFAASFVQSVLTDEPQGSGPDGMLPRSALLDPGNLYERACQADPHPEVFQEWLEWAKKQKDHRSSDSVAELWRRARPQDVSPLLWLMESAGRRGAYQKSLKFLEEAEQLDRLNPEVRKLKLRLLVAGTLRHFRQRKPHLASQGIDRIANLLDALDGQLSPVVSALRRVCSALGKDNGSGSKYEAELEEQLGGPAYLLLKGLADAAGLSLAEVSLQIPPKISFAAPGELASLSKACALGDLLGLPTAIPAKWEAPLAAALMNPALSLDSAQILVIGEAALRSQSHKLAFAVSVAGMASRVADSRFLFLRARSLPMWAPERCYYCLCAALGLARRDHDTELAGRILDELRGHPAMEFGRGASRDEMGSDGFSIKPELLQRVLEEERSDGRFPSSMQKPMPKYLQESKAEESRSRKRRRTRGRFDMDDVEDDIAELDDLLDRLPPELVSQMLEAMDRGESPATVMARLLGGTGEPVGTQKANRERPTKLPPPGQGSLF